MRIFLMGTIFGLALFISGCQKCTASASCTGTGSQSSLDKIINHNVWFSTLGDPYKKAACDDYTALQSNYGSGCQIKWQ
ncbi:MAG: hypothetical protein JNM63_01620 [Spirochaetia bacterium]|nr:hypothetical protein [Spirochaetia bacterium]